MFMEGPNNRINFNKQGIEQTKAVSANPEATKGEAAETPEKLRGASNSTLGFNPSIVGQTLLLMQGANGLKPTNNFFKVSEEPKSPETISNKSPETTAILPKALNAQLEALFLDSPEATKKFSDLVEKADRQIESVTKISPKEITMLRGAVIDINQDAFTTALKQALELDANRSSRPLITEAIIQNFKNAKE